MGRTYKISLTEAKKRVKNKLGVLDMARFTESHTGYELILFHGPRGGHRATYNKDTREFFYVR